MDKVNDFLSFDERMANAMYKASHVDNIIGVSFENTFTFDNTITKDVSPPRRMVTYGQLFRKLGESLSY